MASRLKYATVVAANFTGDDSKTFWQMIRRCQHDYPAQSFVALNWEWRPCVILHFDDGENLDFDEWYFSTPEIAVKAFELLEGFLDEQLPVRFAEKMKEFTATDNKDLPF